MNYRIREKLQALGATIDGESVFLNGIGYPDTAGDGALRTAIINAEVDHIARSGFWAPWPEAARSEAP